MIVATNGAEEYPVKVVHWWPGRQFGDRHMTQFFEMAAWARGGSRYVTVAFAISDRMVFQCMAHCCPKDTPSRARGREIALGWLRKELEGAGYRLECREKGAGE